MNSQYNYIQKAFEITKDNLILVQPPVIFMIILSFTLAGLLQQAHKAVYMIFLVANILLCTAFFAGWFNMIKKSISLNKKIEDGIIKTQEEKASASLDLGKEFFPGVGDYFLQMTLTIAAFAGVYILVVFFSYKAGLQILPHPHIDMNKLYAAANSTPAEMQKFVYGLSFDQLKAINIWMLFMGLVVTIFTFATMFLFPALYDEKKDPKELFLLAPIKAFNRNIIFIFKHFIGSLGILIFLFFLNTVLSILSVIFNLNIILAIVGLIISFYFMTYAMVLVFLYYDTAKLK